jgi:hypothetical protein
MGMTRFFQKHKLKLIWGGWIMSLSQTALLAWILAVEFTPNWQEWSVFFNAKLPQSWFQITLLYLCLFIFDFATYGHTIQAIMECDKETSKWVDRFTAAFFLVGLMYCTVLAMKGGF